MYTYLNLRSITQKHCSDFNISNFRNERRLRGGATYKMADVKKCINFMLNKFVYVYRHVPANPNAVATFPNISHTIEWVTF